MIEVLDYESASDWSEIYNITFKFHKVKKFKSYETMVDNIITFDTETSNGFMLPDHTVIGFDHEKYDANPDEENEYRDMIDDAQEVSVTYLWQMCIEDFISDTLSRLKIFLGRDWEEYLTFTEMLLTEIRRQAEYGKDCINRTKENEYALHRKRKIRLFTYVHNLSFDYVGLTNVWLNDFKVFARQPHKPMKAEFTHLGVTTEMRDTYHLTQKSLAQWCKDEDLPVKKISEPEDFYLKIRTPKSNIDDVIQYSINDVVSLAFGIEKYREKYHYLEKIPLTLTGIARELLRKNVSTVNKEWAKNCAEIMRSYTPDEFKELVQLFQGGWVHGNKMFISDNYEGYTLKGVSEFDLASSYPSVMTIYCPPIEKFEKCDASEFDWLSKQDLDYPEYRWYVKIKFKNVCSKLWNSYWSLSKVCKQKINDRWDIQIKNQVVDNGRIYSCDEMTIMLTDLDFDTFKQCYSFDEDFEIISLKKAKAGLLPKEFILTVLDYFKLKTTLKWDTSNPNHESLLREVKSIFNSFYGCLVQKIICDDVTFDSDGWHKAECDDEMFYKTILDIKDKNTFAHYDAGVWITAEARHNIMSFVIELDKHLAYVDTDSIKGKFDKKDFDFIKKYNDNIEKRQNYVAKRLGFDVSLYTAPTKNGKLKRLGVMEREDADRFDAPGTTKLRVLGAKRYCVELEDGTIEVTVAGLPKEAGRNKIKKIEDFHNDVMFNTRESHKSIAVYNDNQPECIWTDDDGITYKSTDRFGVCLKPTTFNLSLGGDFEKFIQTLNKKVLDDDEYFSDTTTYLL